MKKKTEMKEKKENKRAPALQGEGQTRKKDRRKREKVTSQQSGTGRGNRKSCVSAKRLKEGRGKSMKKKRE